MGCAPVRKVREHKSVIKELKYVNANKKQSFNNSNNNSDTKKQTKQIEILRPVKRDELKFTEHELRPTSSRSLMLLREQEQKKLKAWKQEIQRLSSDINDENFEIFIMEVSPFVSNNQTPS